MNIASAFSTHRRLRIAVLSRVFSATGGGAERYSISLVEQLASRHDIHVFAQSLGHPVAGVHFHKIAQPLQRPRWINQLWFALATWWVTRRGFDVVHSHENSWHGQIQTVHVLPVRYNLFQELTGFRRAMRWLKVVTSPRLLTYVLLEHWRYSMTGHRRIVSTSDSLNVIMAQTYPAAMPAMRVIAPGVSDIPRPVTALEKQEARHKLGLPRTGKCILFVGNDFRKKGLTTLLAALRDLPQDHFLAVVGNPAQVDGVRDELQKYTINDRVFFLGKLGDVNLAYRAADGLAHPTLEDTFAMVVLEAMAHGLPVVVSNAAYCGISGLLTNRSDALILENPRDPGELSAALREILANSGLADALASNGRRFAGARLWSDMARAQELLYFEVLA